MGDAALGFFSALTGWVSANAGWIVTISVLYFVVSLLLIRYLIITIPSDYFLDRPAPRDERRHPFLRLCIRVGKNFTGIIIILVGLIMSLPGVAGQGFLTVLLGLSLTDFPGKRKLELRLVRLPLIQKAINAIREKAGRMPLSVPPDAPPAAGGRTMGPSPDG